MPASGECTLTAKTQNGRANAYLDLNRDGLWDANELVIQDTPRCEARLSTTLQLEQADYSLRVDHATALPSPVLVLALEGPGVEGRREISELLSLP